MSYLYIFLSATCSVLIAHLLKLTETRNLRTLNTLTANYLSAFLISFYFGWQQAEYVLNTSSILLILFAGIVGAFFIGNFLLYSKSVHINGVGVTVAAMRLSLLVPIMVSVGLYAEMLDYLKITGIILVFASLLLLSPVQKSAMFGRIKASWLLVFIFMVAGFADASLKIYEEDFSSQINELLFMSFIFGWAFLIGLTYCIFKEGKLMTSEEALLGGFLGVPNLYSSIFLIWALASIDGAIAYPLVNVLVVMGGTLLGLVYWKDVVTKKQWGGLTLALTAIILLL